MVKEGIYQWQANILTSFIEEIAIRTRYLAKQVCQNNELEILTGHVAKDHVQLISVKSMEVS